MDSIGQGKLGGGKKLFAQRPQRLSSTSAERSPNLMSTMKPSALTTEWMAEEGSSDGTVLRNPATGGIEATFVNASPERVDEAVRAAHQALGHWAGTVPAERGLCLLKLADAIAASAEELATLESYNVGKPLASAREEIPVVVDALRFLAGALRTSRDGGAGDYVSGSTSYIVRQPLGVVAAITAWNYPLLGATWKVAAALAAGNTVVLKPSEITPYTTLRFVELAAEILPVGVLNLVLGDGVTGRALVEHPMVNMVSLTGDISTGKKVAVAASETLKRLHLELGGKAPVLVFDDVPVAETARAIAPFGFVNTGQDCTAACRLIVADAIYDEFIEAYSAEVSRLVVGDPGDENTQMGPLVSERQMQQVADYVERARKQGAVVRTGGKHVDRPGWYYEPTVLSDLEQDAEIVQREVFGPVVTVQRASDDDAMLQMANGVVHGLAASIWTTQLGRTMRFTRELGFGTVWVNQHNTMASEAPFGGFGQSGYGKEQSTYGIEEFTQIKHVMIKR